MKHEGRKHPRQEHPRSGIRERAARSVRGFWNDLRRSGLPRLILVLAAAVCAAGIIVFSLERTGDGMFRRVFDGIWWAVVTVGTVGYGDTYPVSDAGRVFGMLLILAGIVLTALISGTVASLFVERRIREGKGLQELRMKNHILVCGWNDSAHAVLSGLSREAKGSPPTVVLVNSMDAEGFDAVRALHPEMDLRFVRGEFTQETTLKRAGAQNARSAILLPDSSGHESSANADERTILSCLALKALNPEMGISAEILKPENEQHLRRANVDDVIVNGEFSGFLLASGSTSAGVPRAVREMLSYDSESRFREVPIPPSLVGLSFAAASEWFLRNGNGVLLGIRSREKKVTLDDILSDGSEAIDAFIKRKFQEAEIDIGSESLSGDEVRVAPGADYLIREADAAFVVG